ncbi:MAG: hypothetical protein IJJ16_07395 [Mogibacterium sp.]|nr:hypothetical protein [Mogibacterium sp.]
MIYEFTRTEFEFIKAFCGMPDAEDLGVPVDPDVMNDPEAVVSSLTERGCLTEDPEGGYFLPEELTFFMMVIGQAVSSASVVRADKSMNIFFKGDSIVVALRENEKYQIMWIPFMHLLVGAVSSFMAPFINEESGDVPGLGSGTADELRGRILERGFAEESSVRFFASHEALGDKAVRVFSDGKKQLMLEVSGDRTNCSAPDKSDMVNALTRVLAGMHASAIREVLE